jgi:hypothetical protein
MEMLNAVVDFGTAPEIHVDGIARVERVSANVIRVTYFTRHKTSQGIENRIVLHTDWDIDTWCRQLELTRQRRSEILCAPAQVTAH